MSVFITFAAALLIFGAVIAIHEFGHFAVAKLCGVQVNEFSIDMDQCCLCIRRQRFMKTVDHDICPKMHGILREIFGKSEMCSMSFIHNQWFFMCMCNFCNSLHIRNNAIISWRSNHDRLDFRMLLKRTLHICWIDTAI